MKDCESSCWEAASRFIKRSLVDVVLRRPLNEKLINHCHVHCINTLGAKNFKKNGRWGFVMLFGFTEFFSSFFAFATFLMSIYCSHRKILPKAKSSPLRFHIRMQYYVCNMAFISSFLFHMRETQFTRYADYLSAYLSILVGMVVAIARLVNYLFPQALGSYTRCSLAIGVFLFAMHTHRMVFVDWNYFYNKIICGVMFSIGCLADIALYIFQRHMPHARYIIFYTMGLFLAMFIEFLDIAPVMLLFDSHALWHLLMLITGIFYYEYISGSIDAAARIAKFSPEMQPQSILDQMTARARA